jgi:uncharacterized protein (DUF488 family)
MSALVYTIGHSNHPIARLIELLRSHGITAVADVRSRPFSRFNPHVNRDALTKSLDGAGIAYVFLGRELGARSEDPRCYRDGRVQYDLLAQTDLFRQGISRVREGARSHRIALMCAEKEPIDCHRTILVARVLAAEGVAIRHILADGGIETHEQVVERLVAMLGPTPSDLFGAGEAVVARAYAERAAAIAYRLPSPGKGAPKQPSRTSGAKKK